MSSLLSKLFYLFLSFRLLGLFPDITIMAGFSGGVKSDRNIFGNGYITVGAVLPPLLLSSREQDVVACKHTLRASDTGRTLFTNHR